MRSVGLPLRLPLQSVMVKGACVYARVGKEHEKPTKESHPRIPPQAKARLQRGPHTTHSDRNSREHRTVPTERNCVILA